MTEANDSFAERLRRVEPPAGSVALFWMGQASFALKGAGLTILIDPYLSEHPGRLVPPADRPEAFDFVDLVLITHEHLDHLDGPACRLIAQRARGARIVVPAPIVEQVTALGVHSERVLGVQPGGPVTVGAARVWPVPAMHGVSASEKIAPIDRSGALWLLPEGSPLEAAPVCRSIRQHPGRCMLRRCRALAPAGEGQALLRRPAGAGMMPGVRT